MFDDTKQVDCEITMSVSISQRQLNTMTTPKEAHLVMKYEHGDVVVKLSTVGFKFQEKLQ